MRACIILLILASLVTAACWEIHDYEGAVIECQHQPRGRWNSETKTCEGVFEAPDPSFPSSSSSSSSSLHTPRDAATSSGDAGGATDAPVDAPADAAAHADAGDE